MNTTMPTHLLAELQSWKLEAKLEDTERYFFEVAEVESVRSGNKSYVIGRKGTGKTAIGERFLTQKGDSRTFSVKLSFKNFPFNQLYATEDKVYTRPNQFITIWKYIIYLSVCKLMRDNSHVASDARAYLSKLLPPQDQASISRLIPRWVGKNFEVKIFGTGGSVSLDKKDHLEPEDWTNRVDILENFLINQLDASSYLVLFDELDEDYKDVIDKYQSHAYIDLITSLFKAVQNIRSIFKGDKKLLPVVFLRDDIYDLVQDPDKNKWNDLKVELNWDTEKIKKLLAFRISRAIDADGDVLDFSEAWDAVFANEGVPVGHRQNKRMEIFDYISRSTLLRPRDFIRYLQVAAEAQATTDKLLIESATVRTVDKAFSNYLRNEFVDEIHALLPDINEILQIFSQLRKQTFSIQQFLEFYDKYAAEGRLKTTDSGLVLRILFHFSVIGNVGNRIYFFKYLNKEATFNFKEQIVLHRGLFKSLQII